MELLALLGLFLLIRWLVNWRIDALVGADFDRLDLSRDSMSLRGSTATTVLKQRQPIPHADLFLPMPSCDVRCLALSADGHWFAYVAEVRGLKLARSWVEPVAEQAARLALEKHPRLARRYFGSRAAQSVIK